VTNDSRTSPRPQIDKLDHPLTRRVVLQNIRAAILDPSRTYPFRTEQTIRLSNAKRRGCALEDHRSDKNSGHGARGLLPPHGLRRDTSILRSTEILPSRTRQTITHGGDVRCFRAIAGGAQCERAERTVGSADVNRGGLRSIQRGVSAAERTATIAPVPHQLVVTFCSRPALKQAVR
jgi:hypothetical protein